MELSFFSAFQNKHWLVLGKCNPLCTNPSNVQGICCTFVIINLLDVLNNYIINYITDSQQQPQPPVSPKPQQPPVSPKPQQPPVAAKSHQPLPLSPKPDSNLKGPKASGPPPASLKPKIGSLKPGMDKLILNFGVSVLIIFICPSIQHGAAWKKRDYIKTMLVCS